MPTPLLGSGGEGLKKLAGSCRSLAPHAAVGLLVDWTSVWLDLIAMDAPRDHSVNTRHNDPITPSARHGLSDPIAAAGLATMAA